MFMERNVTSEVVRPTHAHELNCYFGNAPQIVRNLSPNGCSLELARMLLTARHGGEDIAPRR